MLDGSKNLGKSVNRAPSAGMCESVGGVALEGTRRSGWWVVKNKRQRHSAQCKEQVNEINRQVIFLDCGTLTLRVPALYLLISILPCSETMDGNKADVFSGLG
jgi:hypothetical protein